MKNILIFILVFSYQFSKGQITRVKINNSIQYVDSLGRVVDNNNSTNKENNPKYLGLSKLSSSYNKIYKTIDNNIYWLTKNDSIYIYNCRKNRVFFLTVGSITEEIKNTYFICSQKKLQGLWNYNGDNILPQRFSNIKKISNFFTFEDNHKIGMCDFKGRIVKEATYDKIFERAFSPTNIITYKNNKAGLLNLNGKLIFDNVYDFFFDSDEGYYIFQNNKKFGIINPINNLKTDFIYDEINLGKSNGNYCIYKKNERFGLISKINLKEITLPIFDKIEYYSHKFLIVSINQKMGIINSENEIIIPIEQQYIRHTDEDFFIIKNTENLYALYDKNIKQLYPFEYKKISSNNGIISLNKNDSITLLNNELKKIDLKFDNLWKLSNLRNHYIAKKDGYEGIINESGKIVVPIKYNNISIENNLLVCVLGNNNIDILNLSDFSTLFIKQSNFTKIKKSSTMAICDGEKWAFIDKNGHLLTKFIFEEIESNSRREWESKEIEVFTSLH